MKQPQEIEAKYTIPLIRKELAKELLSNGLSQKKISELLGISPAAISQYMKSKRADSGIKLTKETMDKIKNSAKKMINNDSCAIKEINEICDFMRKTKCLCKIHKCIESVKCVEGCCCK